MIITTMASDQEESVALHSETFLVDSSAQNSHKRARKDTGCTGRSSATNSPTVQAMSRPKKSAKRMSKTSGADKQRVIAAHVISDSENSDRPALIDSDSDSDNEFLGFVPIQRKKRKVPASKGSSRHTNVVDDGAVPSTSASQPQPLPYPGGIPQAPAPFQPAPQAPGHFQPAPAPFHPMMMYPNPAQYWQYMPMVYPQQPGPDADVSSSDADVGPEEESSDDAEAPDVSLDVHIQEAEISDDVAPPVSKKVAQFSTKIWNKPMRDSIKDIYDKHKRPGNVTCLQKVELDEELLEAMSGSFKAKKHDFALKGLNNAFVHAAIVCCETLQLAMTADKDTDIRQHVINTTADTLKVLSYGAQSTNALRKDQLKPLLNPLVKNKACAKKKSFEDINSSHCLFGGEMPAQMKKGNSSLCSGLET